MTSAQPSGRGVMRSPRGGVKNSTCAVLTATRSNSVSKAGMKMVTSKSCGARASGSPWGCSPPSSPPLCGGVMTRAGEVDLDKLSQADATHLRELVAAAGFFSLPPEIRKRAPASWDFVHELTVRDAGKTHTVCFHLDAVPATLRALCDEVIAQAQGGLNDLRPT